MPTAFPVRKQFNALITGMSVLGTVLEAEREKIKIHLDIDPEQDIGTAFWYKWVPQTGNLMYLMPRVGTRASLYFSNEDETSAVAVNSVRTNGASCTYENGFEDSSCADIQTHDYEYRYLTTEHDKRYFYNPTAMGLVGTSGTATPLFMTIDDDDGIVFSSHGSVNIIACENISIEAPVFAIHCRTELLMSHAELFIEGGGVNPYNTNVNANANTNAVIRVNHCASINTGQGLNNVGGGNTYFAGWMFSEFAPFDDAPEAAPRRSLGGLIGGILAAVAVGVVVGWSLWWRP